MNIALKEKNYQGSVLLVALMMAWIIGIALVSYLTLVATQNRSTYSSLSWNACIPVLEAGIEEAMGQIHNHAKDNLGANQWTLNAADGRYHKSRPLVDRNGNSDGSYFDVAIQPKDPRGGRHGPVIEATGYVPGPAMTGTALGGQTAFGMILGSFSPAPRLVWRTVRVTTIATGWGAVNSKGPISMPNGMLDSFDSSNPLDSTNGSYDPAKRKANAEALTNFKGPNAILVGGKIFGSVTTGPGGQVIANNGSVGDVGWAGSKSDIQPGHQSNDANVQFDDVQPPFVYGTGMTPTTGLSDLLTGLLTPYTLLLGSGNYNSGSINLSGGKTMLVTGDATLYVNGNLSTSGGGGIVIAPGASLKLYIAGSASFTGNGIVNGSGRAKNLSIYGLNTSTSFAYSGSSSFIGTVYAPYAAIKFTGSSEVIGSVTGDNVTFSGGAHLGYDEDLRGDFVVDSWNEI